MARFGIASIIFALAFLPAKAWPQHHHQTIRYPRVYGATGHLYGPTQAYYQYQRQYGHPWNGYGGITAPATVGTGYQYVNGYPAGGLSYGYLAYQGYGGFGVGYGGFGAGYGGYVVPPGYNPFPSYTPPVPTMIYSNPLLLGNGALNPGLPNNAALNQPLNLPDAPGANLPPPPSTAEAKLKSVRAQAQGDIWFKQQEYHKAFDRYKAAVSEAPDRGAAHLRLAICYAALGHLDLAVRQLKAGAFSDPKLAADAEPLKDIYGAQNSIPQASMVHRATLWAKDDIRDPDRLFLLGAMLYLQGDERAAIPLQTGMELQGGGDHFRSFLVAAQAAKNAGNPAAGSAPHPQVIDQTPHPQTTPQNGNAGGLPPLPAPPSSAPGNLPQNPAPLNPILP